MSSKSMVQRLGFVLAAAVLAMVLMLVFGSGWRNSASADGSGVRKVVVKLQPGASISDINSSYQTTTVEKLLRNSDIYLLRVSSASKARDVVSRMKIDGRLVYAELNYTTEAPEGGAWHRARTDGTTATSTSGQYVVDAVNLECAQGISRGKGSVVAVLDTGAQLDHPALADNFYKVRRYDFVDDDADPSEEPVDLDDDADDDGDAVDELLVGHGTHVAGIVDLVAPEAKIMPLRVLDSRGYGNVFTLAEAVYYAERKGADVINLSLSASQRSELLKDAIQDVIKKDVVVVAAAGNANTETPQWPAAVGDVMSVTSVDALGKKSGFANYGTWVDIAAPGNDIQSAFPTSRYLTWSGTSMATPFVAGQAALIHSVSPSATTGDVRSAIFSTAHSLDSLNLTYSGKLGRGHTDVGASLGKIRGDRSCGG